MRTSTWAAREGDVEARKSRARPERRQYGQIISATGLIGTCGGIGASQCGQANVPVATSVVWRIALLDVMRAVPAADGVPAVGAALEGHDSSLRTAAALTP